MKTAIERIIGFFVLIGGLGFGAYKCWMYIFENPERWHGILVGLALVLIVATAILWVALSFNWLNLSSKKEEEKKTNV